MPPPTANPRLGWRLLTVEDVPEKFGVKACQIADYLALVGDTADNIPGLAGVGPKTAAAWLQQHGDLETIIAKANYLLPARFQTLVAAEAERLRINRMLTTLNCTHEVEREPACEAKPERLKASLLELEMKRTAEDAEKRMH
jgi:DNA polymerase I